MNDFEQNISELNIIWIKTIKELKIIIKPINIFLSILKDTSIKNLKSNSLYIFTKNNILENVILKLKNEILKKINLLHPELKINDLIVFYNEEKILKNNDDNYNLQENKKNEFDWLYFENKKALYSIENFIKNKKNNLLIINGPANSGKSFLSEKIINYLRLLHYNVNNYDLSTIYYLFDVNRTVKNNYFIIDKIENFSLKKQTEILNSILKENNFFIITTNDDNFIELVKKNKIKFKLIKLNPITENVVKYILKSKIKFTVYPSSYELLTKYLVKNPKDIDKLLTSLNLFYRQNTNKIVNKEDIDNIVKLLNIKNFETDVDKVMSTVSKKMNISIEDIKSSSRKKKLVISRSLISYILKKVYKYTLQEISVILNRNSHSTIINLIKMYEKQLIDNLEFKNIFNLFEFKN